MESKEFILDINKKHNWAGQKRAVGVALQIMMDNATTSLVINVDKFKKKKSYKQIKGLYRLLGKIVPVLKDIDPSTYFDAEKVKVIIKDQFGYYDTYNGIKLYKSCKDATIEDMMGLIKTAERFGDEMGVLDCFITSEEELALKEFYK